MRKIIQIEIMDAAQIKAGLGSLEVYYPAIYALTEDGKIFRRQIGRDDTTWREINTDIPNA